MACTSVPTQSQWEATIDDFYRAYVYAYEMTNWFEEEENGVLVRWFEAIEPDLMQLDERTFQILCERCYIWGDYNNPDWNGPMDCRLRSIVFRWTHGDPADPTNWTWTKVN